jgi:hypothetical protein
MSNGGCCSNTPTRDVPWPPASASPGPTILTLSPSAWDKKNMVRTVNGKGIKKKKNKIKKQNIRYETKNN